MKAQRLSINYPISEKLYRKAQTGLVCLVWLLTEADQWVPKGHILRWSMITRGSHRNLTVTQSRICYFFCVCKSINWTTEPGSSTILFIEQSGEAKWAYWNNEHAHATSDADSQDFSRLWREQTHRWNFKHSLYFSSSDMLRKENKYHRRLQSTSRLQCTKLISLCYSPKVSPFFISDVQPPQWGNMKEKAECSKDGFVFSIYVNLACFSVFTERSIPKLQGPTLSKMNNLMMITLNFLFCHNCLCNILPEFFSVLNRHDWNQSSAACLFHSGDKKCFLNDFDLQVFSHWESFCLWSSDVF